MWKRTNQSWIIGRDRGTIGFRFIHRIGIGDRDLEASNCSPEAEAKASNGRGVSEIGADQPFGSSLANRPIGDEVLTTLGLELFLLCQLFGALILPVDGKHPKNNYKRRSPGHRKPAERHGKHRVFQLVPMVWLADCRMRRGSRIVAISLTLISEGNYTDKSERQGVQGDCAAMLAGRE